MKSELPNPPETKMADAMALMQQALRLLDDAGAPADIGAHLDLAIVRLGDAIAKASCPWTDHAPSLPGTKLPSSSTG